MNIKDQDGIDSRVGELVTRIYENRSSLVWVMTIGFIIVFSLLTIGKPIYEWDLFAYIGNGLRISQDFSVEQLHTNVFQAAQATVPPDAYARLLGSSSRLVLSQDSEAFRQTMHFFYDARIIYNHIVAGLFKIGIEPVFALYAFSTLCSVGSILLLTRLLPVSAPVGYRIVLPFIVLAFGLMYVARLATPDAFATLVTIGLYFILLRNQVHLLLVLLPIVIFVRTDLIVLIALFQFYFLMTGRASRVLVILSGVATLAAYFVLNNYIVDADPWSSLMGYNFGEKPTHTENYVFPVPMGDYFKYLWIGILSFSYHPMVFVFMMLTITGIVLLVARFFVDASNWQMSNLHADLLFILVSGAAYFILHFILFPVAWMRFFAAQYTLAAVVVSWCTFNMLSSNLRKAHEGLAFLNPR